MHNIIFYCSIVLDTVVKIRENCVIGENKNLQSEFQETKGFEGCCRSHNGVRRKHRKFFPSFWSIFSNKAILGACELDIDRM